MKYRFQSIEHDLFLRSQIQQMNKRPSDSRAASLEAVLDDISIDHSDSDWGMEPNKGRYEPIIGNCEEYEEPDL